VLPTNVKNNEAQTTSVRAVVLNTGLSLQVLGLSADIFVPPGVLSKVPKNHDWKAQ